MIVTRVTDFINSVRAVNKPFHKDYKEISRVYNIPKITAKKIGLAYGGCVFEGVEPMFLKSLRRLSYLDKVDLGKYGTETKLGTLASMMTPAQLSALNPHLKRLKDFDYNAFYQILDIFKDIQNAPGPLLNGVYDANTSNLVVNNFHSALMKQTLDTDPKYAYSAHIIYAADHAERLSVALGKDKPGDSITDLALECESVARFLMWIGAESLANKMKDLVFSGLLKEEASEIIRDIYGDASPSEVDALLKGIKSQLIKRLSPIVAENKLQVAYEERVKNISGIRGKKMSLQDGKGVYDHLGIRMIIGPVPDHKAPHDDYKQWIEIARKEIAGLARKQGWVHVDTHDYVAKPKSSGYESLHIQYSLNGIRFEIQIRTGPMHYVSEVICPHWQYKMKSSSDFTSTLPDNIQKGLLDSETPFQRFILMQEHERQNPGIYFYLKEGDRITGPYLLYPSGREKPFTGQDALIRAGVADAQDRESILITSPDHNRTDASLDDEINNLCIVEAGSRSNSHTDSPGKVVSYRSGIFVDEKTGALAFREGRYETDLLEMYARWVRNRLSITRDITYRQLLNGSAPVQMTFHGVEEMLKNVDFTTQFKDISKILKIPENRAMHYFEMNSSESRPMVLWTRNSLTGSFDPESRSMALIFDREIASPSKLLRLVMKNRPDVHAVSLQVDDDHYVLWLNFTGKICKDGFKKFLEGFKEQSILTYMHRPEKRDKMTLIPIEKCRIHALPEILKYLERRGFDICGISNIKKGEDITGINISAKSSLSLTNEGIAVIHGEVMAINYNLLKIQPNYK